MAILLSLIVVMGLMGCGGGATPADKTWILVWEDNFDSTTVNSDDWAPAVQGLNWNNEDQAYIAENVTIEDGCLVLTAKKEHWEGLSNRVDNPDLLVSQEYTSGEANTKRSWTYGKFEIRAKLPKTQGVLSAFWITPLDKDWPPEIDVMEVLGDDLKTVHFTNHYGTAADHQMKSGSYASSVDLSEDFHIYTVEWEPGDIRWYVDGVLRYESRDGVPSEPFILRLSLPVGPDWEGNPTVSSVFPQKMQIDWVRVYQ